MRAPIRLLVLNVGVFARGVMGAALLSLFLAAPALAQVPPLVETPWQQISTSPVAPFPPVFQAPQWQRLFTRVGRGHPWLSCLRS